MTRMKSRTITMPAPLGEDISAAAKRDAAEQGRYIGPAAWIREACEEKLQREKRKGAK